MELGVRIYAKINGEEVLWENLTEDQKKQIATKLNDDAVRAAGYTKINTRKIAV